MSNNFAQNFELPDTGVTKLLLQTWAEQLNPTSNLVDDNTLKVVNNKIEAGLVTTRWALFRHNFTSFETGGLTSPDVTLINFGPGCVINTIKVNVREVFAGTAIATALLNVGLTPGSPNEFIDDADMEIATSTVPSKTYVGSDPSMFLTEDVGQALLANLVTTGANTDQLDQGEVDIWVQYSIADSELV